MLKRKIILLINKIVQKNLGYRITKNYSYSFIKSNEFFVPISKCVNSYAFSYDTKKAIHPFIALLKQYLMNPGISLEESVLFKFYNHYNPKTLQEAIFGYTYNMNCKTASIPFYEKDSVFRVSDMPLPWSPSNKIKKYMSRNINKTLSVNDHFTRTIETFISIKNYGYNPEIYSDKSIQHAFIRGVILSNENDYRFVVLGGQHRVAALSVLGYDKIPVIFESFRSHIPCIVDINNLRNWPVYKMGIYDEEASKTVFKAFFRSHCIYSAKRYWLRNL